MAQGNNRTNVMRYAGLATSWLITLLVAVWAGYKLDEWLKWKVPVFIIVLPTIAIIYLLWKIIKDFSKPK
jgi:chromate transport protein ChrA